MNRTKQPLFCRPWKRREVARVIQITAFLGRFADHPDVIKEDGMLPASHYTSNSRYIHDHVFRCDDGVPVLGCEAKTSCSRGTLTIAEAKGRR